ncbi:MAG: DUF4142 domain-containing protein [Elusimicrobia bacterium]|nr:DUF4142 domain-containing protein [Elusimicrobiota bacterium]
MTHPTLAALAALLLPVAVPAASQPAGVDAREFLRSLHAVNELEIRVGRLALEKGRSGAVRRYGRVLARDHRAANARVLELARRLRIDVTGAAPHPAEAGTLARLEGAGEEFDPAFLDAMHEGHQEAIALLEAARGSGSPPLRDLVAKLLPILRQHDQLALNLRKAVRQGGRHG